MKGFWRLHLKTTKIKFSTVFIQKPDTQKLQILDFSGSGVDGHAICKSDTIIPLSGLESNVSSNQLTKWHPTIQKPDHLNAGQTFPIQIPDLSSIQMITVTHSILFNI